jgi:hypothetical protein
MKRMATVLLLCSLSVGAMAATARSDRFSGLVRHDSAVPLRFDLRVPSGQQATLVLGDGSRLEFFTPGSAGHAKDGQVRLVSAAGTTLHQATYPGSAASHSLDYLVCGSRVIFISPASPTVPSCDRRQPPAR